MKIICIGRNYAKHIAELANEKPENPVIFLKPDSAILPNKMPFIIPPFSHKIHYEVEVLIKINKVGKYIQPKFAHKYYQEVGLGIDFTARDIQAVCKEKGLPWEKSKAFDGSAVIGKFFPKEAFNLENIPFQLLQNNKIVQSGNTKNMLWKINDLISYVSQYFTLKIGDIIFTGTPEGVGQIKENDILIGRIEDKEAFQITIKIMYAEIITIGDEILIGQIVDTNSQWISKELNKIGISVYQITSIQDEKQHILNALQEAENRVDVVIITGGLGPTKDDITKHTLAAYFNDTTWVHHEEVLENIRYLFNKINRPVNPVQKYQALLPSKATILQNKLGTAPGMWFLENNTVFVSLPGVPHEMKGLVSHQVLPKLQKKFKLPFIVHKTVITYGQGESIIAERIAIWEDNLPDFIKLAYLPSFSGVRLRLSAKGDNKLLINKELEKQLKALQVLIPDLITGLEEDKTIEKKASEILIQKNKTLCTAESLTGGKIAATLVTIPGASTYYKGSFITYSATLKEQLLDVPKEVIDKHTAVSEEVAKLMATNARIKLKTDFAISVTGNAGPATDHNSKTAGLVYIGIASATKTEVFTFNFGKPRVKVLHNTVDKALALLIQEVESE